MSRPLTTWTLPVTTTPPGAIPAKQDNGSSGHSGGMPPLPRPEEAASPVVSPCRTPHASGSQSTPIRSASRIAVMLSRTIDRQHMQFTEINDDDEIDPLVASDITPIANRRPVVPVLTPAEQPATPMKPHPAAVLAEALPKRKPGRPKGWRKPQPSISVSDSASFPIHGDATTKGLRPAKTNINASTDTGRRRPGRPKKPLEQKPRDAYRNLQPTFTSFKCEWVGCKAELHNMETLRKHVQVVHLKVAESPFRCQWRKCAGRAHPRDHGTTQELAKHLDRRHLEPFVWHCGDGPKNTTTKRRKVEEALPTYLFDKNGVQVTPSVQEQKLEDLQTYRRNRRRLKEDLQRINDNLLDEEEEEEAAEEAELDMGY